MEDRVIFLEKLYNKAREIHSLIVEEMDDSDTYNWHNECKYWNADINALAVLIRCFYQEVEGIRNDIGELEEEEE